MIRLTGIRIDPSFAVVAKHLRSVVDRYDRAITRAKRRATNKTASWVGTQVIRAIARENNVPQKVLRGSRSKATGKMTRGRRGRVFINKMRSGYDHANVWIGIRPIAAGYLGTPHQFSYGAKVRGRKFPGAFVATMSTGHVGIFKRSSASRHKPAHNVWGTTALPIEEQYVQLAEARDAVAGIKRQIPAHLAATLNHELDYELRIKRSRH